MKRLVIFGNGRFAEVAQYYFERDSPYRVAAFSVDGPTSDSFRSLPLVDFSEVEKRFPPSSHEMFIAIAYTDMNRAREEKYNQAKQRGYHLASYVSSTLGVLEPVKTGDNCFVLENNVIQPFTTIGDNVVIWSGNHLGHHSRLGDHCFVTSHVCIGGGADIGDHCFLGMNVTIRDGVRVAPRTLVGAGGLVLADTQPDSVYRVKGTPPAEALSSDLAL